MSKLSFRARALDASKPMPIYMAEELPDLPDYSAINRAVPQMPSGMEKEEECEHHLQRAICAGLIIPTPEVSEIPDAEVHDKLYPANYKQPRQLIHMQPFTMEQDIPDYDMDSEDERWLESQAKKLELTPLKFEEMMDQLEKSSGQTVVTLNEAKALLKEDDDLIIAVFDYWLNKRLKMQHPLILSVKTENRTGTAINNPYLAFRRRTEKMQTRKNRKNDETSYEKMLKLKRDLTRAVTLLELVKRREKIKREYVHLTVEIFEKRYQARDFNGAIISELSALKTTRPAFTPIFHNHYTNQSWTNKAVHKDEVPRKEKRQYKKRKHKSLSHNHVSGYGTGSIEGVGVLSSDEEPIATQPSPEPEESEEEGQFAFRRNKLCTYHMPLTENGNWPWCSKEENGVGERKYRYTLTSLSKPRRCIGFARRRLGRGGRVILDRLSNEDDDFWRTLDYTIYEKGDITTNMANKSTVNDSTNSFTNLLGNGINHRNSNNNNIRSDFKTEYSQNNSSSQTSISEVFSESVSENQCTKQESIDAQEKDQIINHHIQEDFARTVQSWLHFRPKTPPPNYEPPCHLLPPEDTTFLPSANNPFSLEMKVLDAPNTFLDTSTFVTTPFLFEDLDTIDVPVTDTRQSSDTNTQTGINLNVNVGFNTLNNTTDSLSTVNNLNYSSVFSSNVEDYLMDSSEESTIGCSRFKVSDIASCTITTTTGSASKKHNKSSTFTNNTKLNSVNVSSDVRLRTNSDGPISNGIIPPYGINASPVNVNSNRLKSYTYFEVMGKSSSDAASTLSLHTSAHTVTLNSHSANLLEIPLPNDTDSVPKKVNSQCTESSTTSPNNKNKTIVRKNNLAMEVT